VSGNIHAICNWHRHPHPLWAWILLAYLVWQGIKAMGPRTTTIWRALIVPAVFIVWGLSRIGLGPQGNVWPLVAWIVAAWRCCRSAS